MTRSEGPPTRNDGGMPQGIQDFLSAESAVIGIPFNAAREKEKLTTSLDGAGDALLHTSLYGVTLSTSEKIILGTNMLLGTRLGTQEVPVIAGSAFGKLSAAIEVGADRAEGSLLREFYLALGAASDQPTPENWNDIRNTWRDVVRHGGRVIPTYLQEGHRLRGVGIAVMPGDPKGNQQVLDEGWEKEPTNAFFSASRALRLNRLK
ncbi:MAG: hypothetical protein AAB553_06945 [Patescibacteria group bacterium]